MLPAVDIIVLFAYTMAVIGLGCWFGRKSASTKEFMAAGGALPGWAVGLSIFGTFLSSNTFLGVPGKAYATNWNAYVFSLSLPIAAWLAVRYFVPFYRRRGEISAYHHLEHRFGAWARTYAVACYLLTQLARTGAILFGVSLAMAALTGWSQWWIIVVAGGLITLYTVIGGIEAVIWTDVVQSLVLMVGAVAILMLLLTDIPGGPGQAFAIAARDDKFSLGSFRLDFSTSTFWVVLLFGLFSNLNNFGIDQSYVQRYHTAKDDHAAARSVWLGALLYVPISLLFFLIGTMAYSYYLSHPEQLAELKRDVALRKLVAERQPASPAAVTMVAETLTEVDLGDRVLPHFIATRLPLGMRGLLVAAIFAAAMSSIDTSLNSSATVILSDLYRRYLSPQVSERGSMVVLYTSTLLMGIAGTAIALAMIRVKSVLDMWWLLSGIFAGGMLGLFLLGMLCKGAGRAAGAAGVIAGVAVIGWLSLSKRFEIDPRLQNPLNDEMTIVVGTLAIFLVGLCVTQVARARSKWHDSA